jgi:transcriptional regulator with XRE-family HTH domain
MSTESGTSLSGYLKDKFREWQEEEVKKRRPKPSLSLFAEKIGVSKSTLCSWLAGGSSPNYSNIQKLVDHFGPDVFSIFDQNDYLPDLEYLHQIWVSLSDSEQKAILEEIKRISVKHN